jgi:chemotaxis signal transduction protein
MVCFRAAGAAYCMPVEATRAVRPATGMVLLPSARPDVAGLIAGDPPLTVISPLGSPLGASGGHILVVQAGDTTFGLLVDAVSGLRRIDDADIRLAPQGQDRALVSGTVDADGDMILVADAEALAWRL